MDLSRQKRARDAHWRANEDVRRIILEDAIMRVQAQLAVSSAQQQRVAQSAVLFFAAAAVCAQIVMSAAAEAKGLIEFILATAAFAGGGLACAAGLLAWSIQLPGYRPAWWAALEVATLTKEICENYRVDNLQSVLDSLEGATRRRGWALRFGTGLGMLGGCLLVLGVFARW